MRREFAILAPDGARIKRSLENPCDQERFDNKRPRSGGRSREADKTCDQERLDNKRPRSRGRSREDCRTSKPTRKEPHEEREEKKENSDQRPKSHLSGSNLENIGSRAPNDSRRESPSRQNPRLTREASLASLSEVSGSEDEADLDQKNHQVGCPGKDKELDEELNKELEKRTPGKGRTVFHSKGGVEEHH